MNEFAPPGWRFSDRFALSVNLMYGTYRFCQSARSAESGPKFRESGPVLGRLMGTVNEFIVSQRQRTQGLEAQILKCGPGGIQPYSGSEPYLFWAPTHSRIWVMHCGLIYLASFQHRLWQIIGPETRYVTLSRPRSE